MWLTCSGSLIPNMLAPNYGSADAAYGTVGHELCEQWIISGKEPRHMLGKTVTVEDDFDWWNITIDEEMLWHAREIVSRWLLEQGTHMAEQRVYFSRLTPVPNQGGRLDFAAIKDGVATVRDAKFGQGVRVYAEKNTQAMLYALGLLYEWDWLYNFKSFRLCIDQPRLGHFDEWECSRDELIEFSGYVKARAAAAWDINAPRTPDPKACLWCKVKSTCSANVAMQFKLSSGMADAAFGPMQHSDAVAFKNNLESFEPSFSDPLALTTEDLARLKPYKRMVEGWWKTADHELLVRATRGERIPGYKLVEGRAFRVFSSPEKALKLLIENGVSRDAAEPRTLVSPAEAEKLLLAAGHKRATLPDLLGGVVKKPPGAPTLATVADKRPELVDAATVAFGPAPQQIDETD